MEKSDEAEPAVSWNAYAKQPFFAGEDFILHTHTNLWQCFDKTVVTLDNQ